MLLIRADAGPDIGTGHVMRCLSLVQGWKQDGGSAIVASARSVAGLVRRLREEEVGVRMLGTESGSLADADETARLAMEVGADYVVVDGYHFGAEYQDRLKDAGLKVLFVDDYGHAGRYSADIILNQNLYAADIEYSNRDATTRCLLGCRYSLLRREFVRYRHLERRETAGVSRILVTLGGADPNHRTELVLDALMMLRQRERFDVKVVVGPACSSGEALRRMAAEGGLRCELLQDVSMMSEWMAWADVAVAAAGTTCWEICFMGLPAVVITMADNQVRVADSMAAARMALAAGWHSSLSRNALAARIEALLSSEPLRGEMSRNAWMAVDGFGVERVCAILRDERRLLREVTWRDCRLLWKWANDPEMRAMSFSPEQIPYERHEAWFRRKMSDDGSTILVLEYDGAPAGQIRFDRQDDGVALIDFYVDASLRGRSLGTHLLNAGIEQLLRKEGSRVAGFVGVVKGANEASKRAFEKSGFRLAGQERLHGEDCLRFEKGGMR